MDLKNLAGSTKRRFRPMKRSLSHPAFEITTYYLFRYVYGSIRLVSDSSEGCHVRLLYLQDILRYQNTAVFIFPTKSSILVECCAGDSSKCSPVL